MTGTPAEILRASLEKHGSGRESVMEILTDVNTELGYIPEAVISELAHAVDVSSAEIYGVVTFYSFFSLKPRGRHIIRLCDTISCSMSDSSGVLEAIEKELGITAGETTADGRVTLETTSCIGLCDQAPAMLVGNVPHTDLTPESACAIIAGLE